MCRRREGRGEPLGPTASLMAVASRRRWRHKPPSSLATMQIYIPDTQSMLLSLSLTVTRLAATGAIALLSSPGSLPRRPTVRYLPCVVEHLDVVSPRSPERVLNHLQPLVHLRRRGRAGRRDSEAKHSPARGREGTPHLVCRKTQPWPSDGSWIRVTMLGCGGRARPLCGVRCLRRERPVARHDVCLSSWSWLRVRSGRRAHVPVRRLVVVVMMMVVVALDWGARRAAVRLRQCRIRRGRGDLLVWVERGRRQRMFLPHGGEERREVGRHLGVSGRTTMLGSLTSGE